MAQFRNSYGAQSTDLGELTVAALQSEGWDKRHVGRDMVCCSDSTGRRRDADHYSNVLGLAVCTTLAATFAALAAAPIVSAANFRFLMAFSFMPCEHWAEQESQTLII